MIKSDKLTCLRIVAPTLDIFSVNVILDANRIIKDIRYLTINPHLQRTHLLEILENKTLVAYAPYFLITEIKKVIKDRAQIEGLSETLMLEKWQLFIAHIEFVETKTPDEIECEARDKKDIPYLMAQEILSIPIISNDKDIDGMNGVTLDDAVVKELMEYGRESVGYYFLVTGSGVTLMMTSTILVDLFKVIPKKVFYWGIALLVAAYLLKKDETKAFFSGLIEIVKEVLEEQSPVIRDYYNRYIQSAENRKKVEALYREAQTNLESKN